MDPEPFDSAFVDIFLRSVPGKRDYECERLAGGGQANFEALVGKSDIILWDYTNTSH